MSYHSKIFVYAGPGAGKTDIEQLLEWARSLADHSRFEITTISQNEVLHTDWENQASAIMFPGGGDIPYHNGLRGKGTQKIKQFVENGGRFVGICAGSYFGGAAISFAFKPGKIYRHPRELSLFKGVVEGPILRPYVNNSESGACAATIITSSSTFVSYYNGGGTFTATSETDLDGVDILGYYDEALTLPAVLLCHVGHGLALLSGPHIECSAASLKKLHPGLSPEVIEAVEHTTTTRENFCQNCWDRLFASI